MFDINDIGVFLAERLKGVPLSVAHSLSHVYTPLSMKNLGFSSKQSKTEGWENYKFKRLRVDISYILMHFGLKPFSGLDKSIPPTKEVIEMMKNVKPVGPPAKHFLDYFKFMDKLRGLCDQSTDKADIKPIKDFVEKADLISQGNIKIKEMEKTCNRLMDHRGNGRGFVYNNEGGVSGPLLFLSEELENLSSSLPSLISSPGLDKLEGKKKKSSKSSKVNLGSIVSKVKKMGKIFSSRQKSFEDYSLRIAGEEFISEKRYEEIFPKIGKKINEKLNGNIIFPENREELIEKTVMSKYKNALMKDHRSDPQFMAKMEGILKSQSRGKMDAGEGKGNGKGSKASLKALEHLNKIKECRTKVESERDFILKSQKGIRNKPYKKFIESMGRERKEWVQHMGVNETNVARKVDASNIFLQSKFIECENRYKALLSLEEEVEEKVSTCKIKEAKGEHTEVKDLGEQSLKLNLMLFETVEIIKAKERAGYSGIDVPQVLPSSLCKKGSSRKKYGAKGELGSLDTGDKNSKGEMEESSQAREVNGVVESLAPFLRSRLKFLSARQGVIAGGEGGNEIQKVEGSGKRRKRGKGKFNAKRMGKGKQTKGSLIPESFKAIISSIKKGVGISPKKDPYRLRGNCGSIGQMSKTDYLYSKYSAEFNDFKGRMAKRLERMIEGYKNVEETGQDKTETGVEKTELDFDSKRIEEELCRIMNSQ